MIKLAGIFTDHMVLIRDKKVCIWGECDGESVTLEIDNIKASARVCAGSWKAYLPMHAAGGPYTLFVSDGRKKIVCEDVYFGEVLVAAGQSNMEVELRSCENGQTEIENAAYDQIRFYNTKKTGCIDEAVEKEISELTWKCCVGEACCDMSAVAFFAAKRLWEELKVPVGIIDCYQGGTSICSWLPEAVLLQYDKGVSFIEEYERAVGSKTDEEYEEEIQSYGDAVLAWENREKEIKLQNPKASPEEVYAFTGDYPWPPPLGRKSVFRPAGCYRSMICQVAPYTVSGIMYYQGETDADYDSDYYPLMEALIKDWRRLFENESLYFVITQLPMFIEANAGDNYSWARIRQAQLMAYENIENTELLVLADCGEYGNIHPVDKKTPGNRMGNLVLETLYGCDTKAKALLPEKIYRDKDNIVIEFKNTYGKIYKAENMSFRGYDEEASKTEGAYRIPEYEFELAASDGSFYPVSYELCDDRVVIKAADDAALVRYAWWNFGKARLRSNAGIPLAPFGPKPISDK